MPKNETSPKTVSSVLGKPLVGLDLSLTATGIVVLDPIPGTPNYKVEAHTQKSKPEGDTPKDEIRRIHKLAAEINFLIPEKTSLVVMEGLAFGSNRMGHSGIVGLAYVVRMTLHLRNIPFVLVAPTSLKKFATDKGNAEKDQVMMYVLERWGYHAKNNNEADAYVLAMIANCLNNPSRWDLDEITKPQREVLTLLQKQL